MSSVREFGKNRKLVWVELNAEHKEVHRLAVEVLTHAMFPDVAAQPTETARKTRTIDALRDVLSATGLLQQFFTSAVIGYLRSIGAELKRTPKPTQRHQAKRRKTHGDKRR